MRPDRSGLRYFPTNLRKRAFVFPGLRPSFITEKRRPALEGEETTEHPEGMNFQRLATGEARGNSFRLAEIRGK
jgi:hypothetical protein